MAPSDFDKREAHRLNLHLQGYVERNSDPKPTPIEVGNLSVTGCLIIGWTAAPGTKARLTMELRDQAPPLRLRVTVMRQTEWDGRAAAGVKFEEPYPLSAENRLSKAMRMLEREAARARWLQLEAEQEGATAHE
jgi:hypothetical protein